MRPIVNNSYQQEQHFFCNILILRMEDGSKYRYGIHSAIWAHVTCNSHYDLKTIIIIWFWWKQSSKEDGGWKVTIQQSWGW